MSKRIRINAEEQFRPDPNLEGVKMQVLGDEKPRTEKISCNDELLEEIRNEVQEYVQHCFDELKERIERSDGSEGLKNILDELLEKLFREAEADLDWEYEGALELNAVARLEGDVLNTLSKLDGILRIIEKGAKIRRESIEALEKLDQTISRSQEMSIINRDEEEELSDEEIAKRERSLKTAEVREKRLKKRAKRHRLLMNELKKLLESDIENIEELWRQAEEFVGHMDENGWLSNGKEAKDLTNLRELLQPLELKIELIREVKEAEKELIESPDGSKRFKLMKLVSALLVVLGVSGVAIYKYSESEEEDEVAVADIYNEKTTSHEAHKGHKHNEDEDYNNRIDEDISIRLDPEETDEEKKQVKMEFLKNFSRKTREILHEAIDTENSRFGEAIKTKISASLGARLKSLVPVREFR